MIKTYDEALSYVYEREGKGRKDGLNNTERLLSLLSNPHLNSGMKYVHVAGTNGKGSATAMIASVLTTAGYKTGRFISPFVLDFRERIQIDDKMIPKETMVELVDELAKAVAIMDNEGTPPTIFEVTTALAFMWYRREKCDVAVLEVGVGGSFDATNIIPPPMAAVVMSVSFDHVGVLGTEIESIAAHKAGIIKEGSTAVFYPKSPAPALNVLKNTAERHHCRYIVPDLKAVDIIEKRLDGTEFMYGGNRFLVPLLGDHQVYNAITVIEALRCLPLDGITDDVIADGIAKLSFPVRMEVLRQKPLVILDGAHNDDAIRVLCDALELLGDREITLLFGVSRTKHFEDDTVRALTSRCKHVFLLEADVKKATPAEQLAEMIQPLSTVPVRVFTDRDEAYAEALRLTSVNGVILGTGSLYLVSELRHIVKDSQDNG